MALRVLQQKLWFNKRYIPSLSTAQSSHSTILIIAICVFFVILLVGISIVRLKSGKDEHESFKVTAETLDWDDSALTITINPMQDNAASEMSDNSSESEDTSDDDDEDGKFL